MSKIKALIPTEEEGTCTADDCAIQNDYYEYDDYFQPTNLSEEYIAELDRWAEGIEE